MRQMRRRELLQALGGIGLVPLLQAGARGQAAGQPIRRLLVFYTPNGTVIPQWRPRGAETGFTVGRILAPLEPWRSKLLILGGVDMALADAGFGSHHTRGIGGLLTGRPILMGNFRSAGPPTAGWASGVSIDQHIARAVGASSRFRTLELGVQVIDAEVRGRISYQGASQPLPPMESPYDAFDRVFAGGNPAPGPTPAPGQPSSLPGGSDPRAERLRAQRRSVLDFLGQELGAVRAWVSADDRARLDAHLESVRDIERRLTPAGGGAGPGPVTPAGCQMPMVGSRMDVAAAANMPAVGKLQMDLAAAALACDLTRVITLQWTHAESNQSFPFIGVPGQHHAMSHAGDTDAAAQENLTKINVWYAEQLKYLLDRLAQYREGDATLLDNSVVLWANEVGKGNNHAHRDLPFLLAGGAGGRLRTGRFLDFMANGGRGQPHNNLLVSLAKLMGLPDTRFGDPAHSTGPLPGLG
jgi:hypothetical protein